MIKNKKGQLSVELIIIIGFLILLAILFAAFFLGFFSRTTETGGEIDVQQEAVVGDYFDHIKNPQTGSMDAITDTYLSDQDLICGGLPYIIDGGNYLCIQPQKVPDNFDWGCNGKFIGTTSDDDGKSNTNSIVAFHNDTSNFSGNNYYDCEMGAGGTCQLWGCNSFNDGSVAAKICDDLDFGGFNDWYLPSKNQIIKISEEMADNNVQKGIYASTWDSTQHVAWSSTEIDANYSYLCNFGGASICYDDEPKNEDYSVRCVRDHYSICGGLPYIEYSGNYLCIHPEGSGQSQWGCGGTTTGAISDDDGKTNTDTIVANICSNSNTAAEICDDLVFGGFNDWYLPAINQLQGMYDQRNNVEKGDYDSIWEIYSNQTLWSSTEDSLIYAYRFIMSNNEADNDTKNEQDNVRCVRDHN